MQFLGGPSFLQKPPSVSAKCEICIWTPPQKTPNKQAKQSKQKTTPELILKAP